MAASYPGTIKSFSTKAPGQAIASSHINDLQDEVVAVETQLGTNAGRWQSWTPTVTGWAAGYNCTARYCKVGKLCFVYVHINGTSNATDAKITLPFSVSAEQGFGHFQIPYYMDNSITVRVGGQCYGQIRPSGQDQPNELWFWRNGSRVGWTASGTKSVIISAFYEVA